MTTEKPKTKFPRAAAIEVAREMCGILTPCCAKIIVAGSLRRRKREVSDVDIVYVPNMVTGKDPADLFGKEIQHNAVDVALDEMINRGVLERRRDADGGATWGAMNKLALHRASGIPVDLFAADHDNWWNLVVCRTGPMESNIRLASAAREAGWKWDPTSGGFTRPSIEKGGGYVDVKMCRSEEEVFQFMCLPFFPPEERL